MPEVLQALETRAGRIQFSLRRSRRRTIEVAVNGVMPVKVAAPRHIPIREIEEFISQKADWIITKLAEIRRQKECLGQRSYETGQAFLFLGKEYQLSVEESPAKKPGVCFSDAGWKVTLPSGCPAGGRPQLVRELLIEWYRRQAEELFGARLFQCARSVGCQPLEVAVRTQKRIWGNCNARARRIHLNWLLILAPLYVIDYVIVHELCHLAVPDHSKRFWQKVGKVMPDYKERQRWLKINALKMALPEIRE